VKLVLAPPDAPRDEWEFDPRRLTVAELDAIEQVTHLSGLTAFGQALNDGSARALRALVWVLRKRVDPPLRYENVDFAIADLAFEDDDVPKDDPAEGSPTGATT
jgi:hypothetical protein